MRRAFITLVLNTTLMLSTYAQETASPDKQSSYNVDVSTLWNQVSDLFQKAKDSLSDLAIYFGIDELLNLEKEVKEGSLDTNGGLTLEEKKRQLELGIESSLKGQGLSEDKAKELAQQYASLFALYNNDLSNNLGTTPLSFDQWAATHLDALQLSELDLAQATATFSENQATWTKLLNNGLSDPMPSELNALKESASPLSIASEAEFTSASVSQSNLDVSKLGNEQNSLYVDESQIRGAKSKKKEPSSKIPSVSAQRSAIAPTAPAPVYANIDRSPATQRIQPLSFKPQASESTGTTSKEPQAKVEQKVLEKPATKSEDKSHNSSKHDANTKDEKPSQSTPHDVSKDQDKPAQAPATVESDKGTETTKPKDKVAPEEAVPSKSDQPEANGGLLGNLISRDGNIDFINDFLSQASDSQKKTLEGMYGSALDLSDPSKISQGDRDFIERLIREEMRYNPPTSSDSTQDREQEKEVSEPRESKAIASKSDTDKLKQPSESALTRSILQEYAKKTQDWLIKDNQLLCQRYYQVATGEGSAFQKATEFSDKAVQASRPGERELYEQKRDQQCKLARQDWRDIFKDDVAAARKCLSTLALETQMVRINMADPFNVAGRENLTKTDEYKNATTEGRKALLKKHIESDIQSHLPRFLPALVASSLYRDASQIDVCELITGNLDKNLSKILQPRSDGEPSSCERPLLSKEDRLSIAVNHVSDETNIMRLVRMHESLENAQIFAATNFGVRIPIEETLKLATETNDYGPSNLGLSGKLANELLFGQCSPLKSATVCSKLKAFLPTHTSTKSASMCDLSGATCDALAISYVSSVKETHPQELPFKLTLEQKQIVEHIEGEGFKGFIASLLESDQNTHCELSPYEKLLGRFSAEPNVSPVILRKHKPSGQ